MVPKETRINSTKYFIMGILNNERESWQIACNHVPDIERKELVRIKTAKISSLKSRDAVKYECPVDEVLYVDRKKLNTILWVIYVMNRQR